MGQFFEAVVIVDVRLELLQVLVRKLVGLDFNQDNGPPRALSSIPTGVGGR